MQVSKSWEQVWGSKFERFHMPYIMIQGPWMMLNLTTSHRKELLVVIFALENFCSHLIGTKATMFSNHATHNIYLLRKKYQGL